ncbi:MAG TPA: hypothetical protein VGC24_08100 [Burkholderiaceae bacterium]
MWAHRALAQEAITPETAVQIQPLTQQQAEQERLKHVVEGKPKSYEDKFMDPTSLPELAGADDSPPNAEMGLRHYLVEGRFGAASTSATGLDASHATGWGLRSEYRQETLNYGEWVMQADTRSRSGGTDWSTGLLDNATESHTSRLVLRNLGLPITPTLFADTSVGDIYSEVTDAMSRNYRLMLGSSPVRGMSTRIFASDFDLRLGTGQRGSLIGDPYPGFERSQGTLSWAGYTQRLPDRMFAGLQFSQATHVQSMVVNSVGGYTLGGLASSDINSAAASFGYGYEPLADNDKKLRVTLLRSNASSAAGNPNGSAQGLFAESGLRLGRYRHEFGVYRADPNLYYGDWALTADNRGGYWRVDNSGTRLSWGGGLDYEQTNPNRDPSRFASDRVGASGNVQWRLDRDSSLGGNFNTYRTHYTGATAATLGSDGLRSLNASAFYATRLGGWGRSRFSLTTHRNETLVANDIAATGNEIQWEHDWITGRYETMRPEFTTTLGYAQDDSGGTRQTYPTAGLMFRYWASADWSTTGNLRYTSRSSNLFTSRGLSGSLTSERQLGNGWHFGASLSLNQTRTQTSYIAQVTPLLVRSNEKQAYVYLRWEASSGTPFAAAGLGSSESAGAGRITGVVYLDANRDGTQQASENGAPNVDVILDQRYRVTTDRDGRFEFPMVSTGRHQLTLRPESVPLPWGTQPDQVVNVEVQLRASTSTSIPVVRVGE